MSPEELIRDFRNHYTHTYVRLQETKQPVFISEINGLGLVIHRRDSKYEQTSPPPDYDYSKVYNLEGPCTGLYPYKQTVLFVQKKNNRQWVEGFSPSTYKIIDLATFEEIAFNLKVAETVYTYDVTENENLAVLPRLQSLRESSAKVDARILSPFFSATKDYKNRIWITMNESHIGYFENPEKLLLFSPVFKQETLDLFAKNGIYTTIEVING